MTLFPENIVLKLWQFTAAIIFVAVFFGLKFLFFISGRVLWGVFIIMVAVFLVVAFFYQPRLFKNQSIKVEGRFITVTKGFIIKREYIYPDKRLAYLKYYALPFHYCLKLYVIQIKGVGSGLLLPPLTEEQVKKLQKVVGDGAG